MSFVFVSPFVSTLLTPRKCRLHHSSGDENHLSRRQKNETTTTTTTTTFLSTKTFWNHHLHRRHTIGDVDDDDVFDDAKVFEEDEGRRRDKSRFGRTAMALVLSAGMLLQPTTTFEAHASVTEEADDVFQLGRLFPAFPTMDFDKKDDKKKGEEKRPRWETKAEERALMMREYDRVAMQQKEEKEALNRKATAVYARQAAERKTLARIEKEGNPDGLSQSEKERTAKEEGEKAYEMTMNAIDASELELKEYNARMEERRRTALERNREELEKLEEMERKENEENALVEQISKNCEKSLEDVNPFDDTVCI